MNICNSYFVTMILLICTKQVRSDNPGIQVRVNSDGLNEIKDIALTLLDPNKLTTVQIPDLRDAQYQLYNLKIVEFHLGKVDVTTSPPNSIVIKLTGANIKIKGRLEVKGVWGGLFGVEGDLAVTVSGVDITQSIRFVRNPVGKPTFTVGSCLPSIASLRTKLSNAGWFITSIANSIIGNMNGLIKVKVQNLICTALSEKLHAAFNKFDREISVDIPVIEDVSINVALVRPPSITESNITVGVLGRCCSGTRNPNQRFPFSAPPLPTLPASIKMFLLEASDYVLNTFVYSLWQNGVLAKTVPLEQLTSQIGINLTTLLLADFVPILRNYTQRSLQIDIHATQPPCVAVTRSGLVLNGTFEAEIVAKRSSMANRIPTDLNRIVSATFNVTLTIAVRIDEDNVKGNVSELNMIFTRSHGIPVQVINQRAQLVVPLHLLPLVNSVTEKGLRIPTYNNYQLSSATLKLEENSFLFATNVTKIR